MPVALNLEGKRFGRLSVISKCGTDKRGCILWLCQCDCGKTSLINGAKLKNGHTKSCGCLAKDGTSRKTHGKTGTRLYRIWQGMKSRCGNANVDMYRHYGGRGITVCQEWRNDFDAFQRWALANGYRDDLSIDRVDNDGPYCPENCRWATAKQQSRNTRRSTTYEYAGESHTLAEWGELRGINYHTLHSRVVWLGWSIERALQKGG